MSKIIKDLMNFAYEMSECRFPDGCDVPWEENEPPNERASRLYAKYENAQLGDNDIISKNSVVEKSKDGAYK